MCLVIIFIFSTYRRSTKMAVKFEESILSRRIDETLKNPDARKLFGEYLKNRGGPLVKVFDVCEALCDPTKYSEDQVAKLVAMTNGQIVLEDRWSMMHQCCFELGYQKDGFLEWLRNKNLLV